MFDRNPEKANTTLDKTLNWCKPKLKARNGLGIPVNPSKTFAGPIEYVFGTLCDF